MLKRRKPKIRKVCDNDYKGLSELMSTHCRTWYTDFTNSGCIKCGGSSPRMLRVYALFFCPQCFLEEFNYKAKDLEQRIWKKWLRKGNKDLQKRGLLPRKTKGGK